MVFLLVNYARNSWTCTFQFNYKKVNTFPLTTVRIGGLCINLSRMIYYITWNLLYLSRYCTKEDFIEHNQRIYGGIVYFSTKLE